MSAHKHHTNHHIAPSWLIAEDFRNLSSRVTLRTEWNTEQMILIQSIASHAHAGHGMFHGSRYPNTTEDDVAHAMRLDPSAVKAERQKLIDDIRDYAERAIDGKASRHLVNADNQPLLGIGLFRHLEFEPKGVLRGLYLGGLRDEPEIRAEAERRYGARIGWGECYLVDRDIMRERGISGDVLAHESHADNLDEYRKIGLITDKPGPTVSYMYIRHHTGPGASDDAAIVIAGKLYGGISAAVGTFLADAIDTLEKYAERTADQDAEVAEFIESAWKEIDVNRSDAVKLAFLAAIPEGHENDVPDNSLRGLLEIDRTYDICALESHLLYLSGSPYEDIDLDHGEATTKEFYDYIESRLKDMH